MPSVSTGGGLGSTISPGSSNTGESMRKHGYNFSLGASSGAIAQDVFLWLSVSPHYSLTCHSQKLEPPEKET